jgi:hypothetical protein
LPAVAGNSLGVRRLASTSSSRRFKKEIKAMDNASEAILALKPVTFHNEFLKEHRKVQEQEATITQMKQEFQSKLAENSRSKSKRVQRVWRK